MSSTLRLAVAQPFSALGDIDVNVSEHAKMIRSVGGQVVLFPELSLTGYAMDVEPLEVTDPRLSPLIQACAATGSTALVGAPTAGPAGGRNRISTLLVDSTGIVATYDKMFLGGDESEYYESGATPSVVEIGGWRLGLAICKDNGHTEHAAATTALGIDAYLASVCEHAKDGNVQPERAKRVTQAFGVWVGYASFAGPTGGGFANTAGCSAVWDPNGTVRLQLGGDVGQCGLTTLTRDRRV